MNKTFFVAAAYCMLMVSTVFGADGPKDAEVDVDVSLTNDFGKEFTDLPVLIQVFRIFGRGVDYSKFNPKGFHVFTDKGDELPFSVRPVPPDFSLANDEIVLSLPKFAKGEALKLRFTNTRQNCSKEIAYDAAKLVANPNNLISNGGFEKGADGWEGGKVISDVVHSGKSALMLEAPGGGGHAALHCTKPVSFTKGMNYYFGVWARCENVVRHTWRHTMPWALQPDSGRISFSGDPLVFPEYDGTIDKNHLIRLMDTRDWYCYEANALSTLCIPQPALNTCASTLTLALDQENMPYLDANKPARVWIDEVLLFEQPKIEISWERIQKKLAPDGFFLYRRAPTCLDQAQFDVPRLDPPRPYERIEKISDAAALGERKLITLGIHTLAPIQGLCLEVGDLKGPNNAVLGESTREIEFNYTPTVKFAYNDTSLEGWVIDGNAPRNIDRPGFADYLIGFRIAADATPGKYHGAIKIKGNGKDLGEVPLELEIVNLPLKVITDRLAGFSYNGGEKAGGHGATVPPLDENFYKYYSRCNLTYMMMFCRFLPFKGDAGTDVDIPTLLAKVKQARDVGGCTAGVGLYWDCAVDKGENGHGLWTRSGKNQDAYRARVKEMDEAIAKAGLPPLVYMIWDEVRTCEPILGILKGTGACTTSDINYRECCQQLQQGLLTNASVDGPGCDYGPAFRKFAEKCGQKVGFDTEFGPFCHRYQTSFMLSSGAATCSCWHVGLYTGYHQQHKALVRGQTMVGVGEGMIDYRYFATLQEIIADAKKKGSAKKEVDAAEKYLKEIMSFCTDDFHFMTDMEIFTYNGGPERWGDDWFYDHWRAELRRHALEIQGALGGEKSSLHSEAPRKSPGTGFPTGK